MTHDPDRAAWLRRPRDYLRRADPVRASLIDDRHSELGEGRREAQLWWDGVCCVRPLSSADGHG